MRVRLVAAALVLAPPLIAPSVASACGDVRTWVESYERPNATDTNRRTALAELSGVCGKSADAELQRRVRDVLFDGERRAYEPALLRGVLEAQRCLPAVERTPELTRLITATKARCR